MFKRIAASLFALVLAISPALAGSGTIAVTPGSGATYEVITQSGGNFVGMFGLCDGVAAAQCVAVKAASTAAVATDPAVVVTMSPNTVAMPVTGTFWQTTQPISAASLPLPTGASTGIADNVAWTVGTTPATAIGCEYTSGGATALTTGHVGTPGCTAARGLFSDLESVTGTALGTPVTWGSTPSGVVLSANVNCITGCSSSSSITGWAGGTLGAMANYGTSPGAVLVPGVNAFVTNSNANGQATMANSSPAVLPSNQQVADPCMFQAKTKVAFSTTSGSTQLVALSGSTKIYVCAVHFISTSADSISFVEGTGTACATSATAVSGSTTAASGMDFPANGGMTEGSGVGTVMNTAVAGDELCLLQSGTTKVAGNLEVVQQ